MLPFDDLPASAVRLITRAALTRRIPGTNRFARISRSWRDAAPDSEDQEQLQLLLALEGLPADSVTSTAKWLSLYGQCVASLSITYNPGTAGLFQQLPLSTASLINLARLEVDGPDSLVALAPALPQLVALTHLRACIELLVRPESSTQGPAKGVFSARGVPLEQVPSLQQLCPGLRSLHLVFVRGDEVDGVPTVDLRLPQLLPQGLDELHLDCRSYNNIMVMPCVSLTALTSLRRLTLAHVCAMVPDLLLQLPALDEVDLHDATCHWPGGPLVASAQEWAVRRLQFAPEHVTKLAGMDMSSSQYVLGAFTVQELLTAVSGLRKARVLLVNPGDASWVLRLGAISGLKHLSLRVPPYRKGEAPAAVSALSGVQQLTYLRLAVDPDWVPRSTWAAVLPHLTQLRVLGVTKQLLLEGPEGGLVAEVSLLTQLQCLYVECRDWAGPAATGAEVAPHLQELSKCSSLKAVLCWALYLDGAHTAQPLWEYVHEGGLHLSCWHKWRPAALEGRVVCPRSCPHLPGVWELPQEQPADGVGSD